MNLVTQKPRNFMATWSDQLFVFTVSAPGEIRWNRKWSLSWSRARHQIAAPAGQPCVGHLGSHDQQWPTGASPFFFCVANGFCVLTQFMLLSTMLSCFWSRIPANVLIKSYCMKDESSGIASNRSGAGPQGFPAETLQSMDRTLLTRPQTQTIIILLSTWEEVSDSGNGSD